MFPVPSVTSDSLRHPSRWHHIHIRPKSTPNRATTVTVLGFPQTNHHLGSSCLCHSLLDVLEKKRLKSNGPPFLTASLPTVHLSLVVCLLSRTVISPAPQIVHELNNLVETAIPVIPKVANPNPPPQPLPLATVEAFYLLATFETTTVCTPESRNGLPGFRTTARWLFGRVVQARRTFSHAKDCFDYGIRNDNESSLRYGCAALVLVC